MRNIMSDAGLAGPLPELLFPSVLLATALILAFNAVVFLYVLFACLPVTLFPCFSISPVSVSLCLRPVSGDWA